MHNSHTRIRLRGSNGPGRDWWDVLTYKIHVTPDYNKKSINGSNEIQFKVLQKNQRKANADRSATANDRLIVSSLRW